MGPTSPSRLLPSLLLLLLAGADVGDAALSSWALPAPPTAELTGSDGVGCESMGTGAAPDPAEPAAAASPALPPDPALPPAPTAFMVSPDPLHAFPSAPALSSSWVIEVRVLGLAAERAATAGGGAAPPTAADGGAGVEAGAAAAGTAATPPATRAASAAELDTPLGIMVGAAGVPGETGTVLLCLTTGWIAPGARVAEAEATRAPGATGSAGPVGAVESTGVGSGLGGCLPV
ncbi:hypothetical protein V8C86DRAFT_2530635 [Haematococcus lacustris]